MIELKDLIMIVDSSTNIKLTFYDAEIYSGTFGNATLDVVSRYLDLEVKEIYLRDGTLIIRVQ